MANDYQMADSQEQTPHEALPCSLVRWLRRVDVHDGPLGNGTQDLVWQGIDGAIERDHRRGQFNCCWGVARKLTQGFAGVPSIRRIEF